MFRDVSFDITGLYVFENGIIIFDVGSFVGLSGL